jgi:TPR repeat protein
MTYLVVRRLCVVMVCLTFTPPFASLLVGQNFPVSEPPDDVPTKATAGDSVAQTTLGVMLLTGQGRKADTKAGLVWVEKAAHQGNALAQRIMGDVLSSGRLVKKDDPTAVLWYRRAAEGGDPDAQSELGMRYTLGFGVPQDDAEGVKWELAAAAGGDVAAMMYLGPRYEQGKGVPWISRRRSTTIVRQRTPVPRSGCATSATCTSRVAESTEMRAKPTAGTRRRLQPNPLRERFVPSTGAP